MQKRIWLVIVTCLLLTFDLNSILPASSSFASIFSHKLHGNGRQNFTEKRFHEYARRIFHQTGLYRYTDIHTFETCLIGYLNLKRQGLIKKEGLLVFIDYRKPSTEKRFFVLDLKRKRLLFKCLVAHGRNSGERLACSFSNRPGSYKSCLGFFITGEPYSNKHGYSLNIKGVEPGINDLAESRRIVIHGADYVSRQFIKKYGRIGRSLGCPALPNNLARPVIDTIKNGSCLFIFGNDKAYLAKSKIVDARSAIDYFNHAGI